MLGKINKYQFSPGSASSLIVILCTGFTNDGKMALALMTFTVNIAVPVNGGAPVTEVPTFERKFGQA